MSETEFLVARVFDFADPVTGPAFRPDHELIGDPARRDRLLAYLRAGQPVLTTAAVLADVIDPAAGEVVPTSFRTDGRWIWTDTVGYYLEKHSLAPDEALLAHVEAEIASGTSTPDADPGAATRAAAFLLGS